MGSQFLCPAFIFLSLANFFVNVRSQSYECLDNGNYTSNDAYWANLNTLLSTFPSKMDSNGFYNASEGENSNKVNAMALCRGDIQPDRCRSCVENATATLPQLCPNQKQAISWSYDDVCMLRYSNASIFGKLDTFPSLGWSYYENVTSIDEFNRDLRRLLDSLRGQASSGGPLKKYAAGNTTGPDFWTIYGLVQCTPDLTLDDCSNCLIQASQEITGWYNGRRGLGTLFPSCMLRYETTLFYNNTPTESPPSGKNDDNTNRTALIIVLPIVFCLILIVCIAICIRWRWKGKRKETIATGNEISIVETLNYDFAMAREATDNFSDANKLGQGGFGVVYKGKLISGQEIAVKRLSTNSGQGDLEFKNEAVLLTRLQHRNLVRLLGFSLHGNERLLVYEYVENGSLDQFLFDPTKRPHLDWERRYKIIGGVARAILYLHEDSRLRIIHRDLKASNVLLDEEMNPKISDFGMARLFVQDETQGNTSEIVGTYGYMAPEYVIHGQFSSKSDVFSFGILVLEIITGQKINSFRNGESVEELLSYAWRKWQEGAMSNIIDPTMLRSSSGSLHNILRCIHVGLLCVQENAADRPTMASVVLMLTSFSMTLPIPSRPAFFLSSTFDPEIPLLQEYSARPSETQKLSSSKTDAYLSTNDVSMSELEPR